MDIIITPVLYSVVIINIILSALVLFRGIKNRFNILFSLMSFAVAVWGFAIIGFYTETLKFEFNWIALTHSSALFSSLILLYFSTTFPKKLVQNKFAIILPTLIFLVTSYYLFFSNIILGKITGVAYEINRGYIFYEALLIIYFLLSYVALFIQYRKSNTAETREQVKYIFIGSIIASLFGMVTNLILPALNIFNFTWLGPIFTFALVTSIFIAILKYNLFNIKIIITELLSIIIIVALSIDLFVESNVTLIIIKSAVLVGVSIFAYFLVKSVYREVQLRENIEKLAKDLEIANESLEKANDRLKELDQLKSEFLSLATHQIRGPLTAIKGYASLLLEGDYGKIPVKAHNAVQVMFNSTQNLIVIVNEFLDISRIEQGRMKYDMVDFDMNTLVTDIVTELKPMIDKAQLSANIIIDKHNPCEVHADMGKIKQVVGNLIDNSIKYTPHGGITVSVSKDNKKIKVQIKDTGIGIAEDDVSKLFAKFSRAKDAFRTNVIGTGLGLYVAKQMIEAQGGKVWVESEGLGKGSTFYIELPEKSV